MARYMTLGDASEPSALFRASVVRPRPGAETVAFRLAPCDCGGTNDYDLHLSSCEKTRAVKALAAAVARRTR